MTWAKVVLDGSASSLTLMSESPEFIQIRTTKLDYSTPNASGVGASSHFKWSTQTQFLNSGINGFMCIDVSARYVRMYVSIISDDGRFQTLFGRPICRRNAFDYILQTRHAYHSPPAIAHISIPQLDRITPRQNVLTASTGNGVDLCRVAIREADDIAAAIAALKRK